MYKNVKSQALTVLRNHFVPILLVTLMFLLCTGSFISPTISYDLMGNVEGIQVTAFSFIIYETGALSSTVLMQIASVAVIVSLALLLFFLIPLSYGYEKYLYQVVTRGEPKDFSIIFSAYKDGFGKIVCVNFLSALFIFFGTICFVIPGIVMACMYLYVNLVMIKYPELGVFATLRKSATLVSGHKMSLFLFSCSFILWFLLASFTYGVGMLFVTPYVQIAFVIVFNRMIADRNEEGIIETDVKINDID